MHEIDRNLELVEVLHQRFVVVAGHLEKGIDLCQRDILLDPVNERAKALPGLRERQGGATLEALVARQEGTREKARDMLELADIDANIEGLMSKQRRRLQARSCLGSPGHGPSPCCGISSLSENSQISLNRLHRRPSVPVRLAPLKGCASSLRSRSANPGPEQDARVGQRHDEGVEGNERVEEMHQGSSGVQRGRSRMPWACLSQLRMRSCPSSLYQVCEHAPQLTHKAHGPKDYQSCAASRSTGRDPLALLPRPLYLIPSVVSTSSGVTILSEGL
jgi:hypothetical protein